ncbi:PREDICTED: uncharacterized protein LOC109590947 [Amphimedon queenslandica]|uniref:Uncharacterized protein n=2 Tax=Amphimedon queenslandica TaxID=400682 RepID=A0AAN0JZJ2_AMPQE|nr:PREDICTED: uncharacterized protein LOC109590947 [Amphimedon queenslandica]|eukprot:XP_019862343.1 PREDICTED: uncharacterized protein LOC109590947 [Amphimedon queenslandica]
MLESANQNFTTRYKGGHSKWHQLLGLLVLSDSLKAITLLSSPNENLLLILVVIYCIRLKTLPCTVCLLLLVGQLILMNQNTLKYFKMLTYRLIFISVILMM